MRNNYDYWEKFAKTGNIFDYLNYTACTAEDSQLLSRVNKEGGLSNDNDSCAGDGAAGHAYWGL